MNISKVARNQINAQVAATRVKQEELATALTAYNENVNDLKGLLESERDEAQEEWDSKSERWQESDNGTNAAEWIDSLTEIIGQLDPLDDIEFVDMDDVDQLGDSP